MTREIFDIFIDEMERLTLIVCPPSIKEEYWLKWQDAESINVQETIFKNSIKIENFPITYDQFEEVVKILEEGHGSKMPDHVKQHLWDDYSHLNFEDFREKICCLLKGSQNDS